MTSGQIWVYYNIQIYGGDFMKRTLLLSIICMMLCFISISCDLSPTGNNKKAHPDVPFEVQIEKTHSTIMGNHEYVDITVIKGSKDLYGFDLLIGYEASVLAFITATPGSIIEECNWDYFTYRYGPDGNCNEICPSGMIRIVGIAETNNGPAHPTCFGPAPYTLVTIEFLFPYNPAYECMYIPVRFFWTDCGDNMFVYNNNTKVDENTFDEIVGISRKVFEFEGFEITDEDHELPWYSGAPTDPCIQGENRPTRYIDFINGGIDNVCNGSTLTSGDLNLNGIGNEIGDAVLYMNYFVYGLGVFTEIRHQTAASDINRDGMPLTVADFVYQIRIIIGDALPYVDVWGLDTAQVNVNNDIISVNGIEMGAAFIVLEGNINPTILFDQMEMNYNYDAVSDQTRILIYSFDGHSFNGGQLLKLNNGEIVKIELATREGKRVFIEIGVP